MLINIGYIPKKQIVKFLMLSKR